MRISQSPRLSLYVGGSIACDSRPPIGGDGTEPTSDGSIIVFDSDVPVIDAGTLDAEIRVRSQGPRKARLWDVVVLHPMGGEARLADGLRVEP